MPTKPINGLVQRGEVWHIRKSYRGHRIRESTNTTSLQEAEAYLAKRLNELRESVVYGTRPRYLFEEAAAHYLNVVKKKSIHADANDLASLMPYLEGKYLDEIHDDSIVPFKEGRAAEGRAPTTVNRALRILKRLLGLAERTWRDENNRTWLERANTITLVKDSRDRPRRYLSPQEETALIEALPEHLQLAARFCVNTGLRSREVTGLRWDMEGEMKGNPLFVLPAWLCKGRERVVPLNKSAQAAVEAARGRSKTAVFTYKGLPFEQMHTSAWKRAQIKLNLPLASPHSLRHTFGHRLRALGVSQEDRADLLGHEQGNITTHYSAAQVEHLIQCVLKLDNQACHKFDTIQMKRPTQGELSV